MAAIIAIKIAQGRARKAVTKDWAELHDSLRIFPELESRIFDQVVEMIEPSG